MKCTGDERPTYGESLRRHTRRPVTPEEVPYLKRLGGLLRELRREAGLTQEEVAWRCLLSTSHLKRLEHGGCRTRRNTLRRIAKALTKTDPRPGRRGEVLALLVEATGPALAPESEHADRIERRRDRRKRKGRYGGMWPRGGESPDAWLERCARSGVRPHPDVRLPASGGRDSLMPSSAPPLVRSRDQGREVL